MKDVNELNGVRAELKVVGAKHNANVWVDLNRCYSNLLVCGLPDLQKRWVEVLDTQEVLPI
jgi:phage terminase Nu1 subunit (DNA packaging protein)